MEKDIEAYGIEVLTECKDILAAISEACDGKSVVIAVVALLSSAQKIIEVANINDEVSRHMKAQLYAMWCGLVEAEANYRMDKNTRESN